MEALSDVMTILALFAAAHERAIEALRSAVRALPAWLDRHGHLAGLVEAWTDGALSAVTATVFALATNANALDLFQRTDGGDNVFMARYLWRNANQPWDGSLSYYLVGCALMGFAIALGSRFWHDVAAGVVDIRRETKKAKEALRPPPAPPFPPASMVVPQP